MGVNVDALARAVAEAPAVLPTGSGTHWEVGYAPAPGLSVRAPSGVFAYEPAELTVTVGAGTTCADLDGVLGEAGQECVLDPRDPEATVGGVLATGLSGYRRLRYGPLRDRLLEVRFVTAAGRLVKGGGPTVKNVSGFDLPRLLVGSLGTIGVMTQVILRCQPRPAAGSWYVSTGGPELRARLYRPSCVLWDGRTSHVLLEGHPADLAGEATAAGLDPAPGAPSWPAGPHRGRASVRPGALLALQQALDGLPGVSWLAEVGVGTVHIGAATVDALAAARVVTEDLDGWLLREAGAPELDPFGIPVPNREVMARVKGSFDPDGKLSPGRLRLEPRVTA